MFGSRIRVSALAHACRSLGTLLHSGVGVKDAFEVTARKTRNRRCRAALEELAQAISRGEDIASAMRDQGRAFPGLVIDMVEVAEQSGALPEILIGLADHYEDNLRLRRNFLLAIAWPAFQLVAAILVIALMIFVLGWIAETRGGEPLDILGFGLIGAEGAITWLCWTFGPLVGLLVAYRLAEATFAGKRFVDPLLMAIPVVGRCMRSFAIARFSWAFYLTQQTGMPIAKSLQASLRATSNGAFLAAAPRICALVNSGSPLTEALEAVRLFPEDFLHMVDVAETSGTVPETLNRLSPQFEDQARRSLTALCAALAWLIWALVATFVIFLIFRVFSFYVSQINQAAGGL